MMHSNMDNIKIINNNVDEVIKEFFESRLSR